MRLRCSKCFANVAGVHSTESLPDFRRPLWRCSTCCTCRAKRRRRCSKCCACHAKWDWRASSAAPATQTQPASTVITQSSPDFRRLLWRCSTCCTCHRKWDWGAPSAACHANAAGVHSNYSILAGLPQTSLEVLHVLHLPQKMRLRCSKCCACHANAAGVHSTQSSPDFRGPLWRCSACCTCHAKRDWRASSAAPATQTQPASIVITQSSPDFRGPSLATQNETEVLQVLRLPRKMRLRCSKCCTCHANAAGVHSIPSGRLPRTSVLKVLCCVDDDVLMVLCWWWCLDGVVLMMFFLMM